MKTILSQRTQCMMQVRSARGMVSPTLYVSFMAQFSSSTNVLVCELKCEEFSELLPHPLPQRRQVIDIKAGHAGDWAAHAVRTAIKLCDSWFDEVRGWCRDQSRQAEIISEAQS